MTNNSLAIVIGLVVLSIILLSLSIGVGCFFYRQKKKTSLTSETSPAAESNIYVASPTVSKPDNVVVNTNNPPTHYEREEDYENTAIAPPPALPPRDKDDSDTEDVEYEEAATVTPPEIPSREKRP